MWNHEDEAWIVVLDHPFAAVTDEAGAFQINLLPVGEYRLRMWHEHTGDLQDNLSVTFRDRKIVPVETVRVVAERLRH